MCHITIIKQLDKTGNLETDLAIKDLIADKMLANKDGFFVANKATGEQLRTLDMKQAEALLDTLPLDSLIVHSRHATAGGVTVDNVHGWILNGWQFAHNGQISDYSPTGEYQYNATAQTYVHQAVAQTKTDSLILFEKIIGSIQHNSIKKVAKAIRQNVRDVGFWGRASLYDIANDRLYIFGDWYTYLINEQYLIISSSDLEFDTPRAIKTHGLTFDVEVNGIHELYIDGLAVIENFTKTNFNFKALGKLETISTYKSKTVHVESNKSQWQTTAERASDKAEIAAYNKAFGFHANPDIPESFFMQDAHGVEVECTMTNDGIIHAKDFSCCDIGACNEFYDLDTDIVQRTKHDKLDYHNQYFGY